MNPLASAPAGDIAIIGMAGRFPGADSVEALWANLLNGVEALQELQDSEMLAAGVNPALLSDPHYVKKATYLEGSDLFDAEFFGYTPREAESLDPQQRLFLECAWEALENSGYGPGSFEEPAGVYGGASVNTYALNNLLQNKRTMEAIGAYQFMLASEKDYLATRTAYKLNLRGPAVTVQTACSTSLVAIHLACRALSAGDCRMALAGGVSATFPEKSGYLYSEGMILSPDGHCRPFDADARGTRGSAGVCVVVLKPLADALRDCDTVRAVIKGTAVNNDGATKMGFSAPSIEGQASCIESAQQEAGVHPESIGYLEAHGTGTQLGDPIEVAALARVFGRRTDRKGYCMLGSIKSNLGHLDAAAGVTGLIKAVLVLEREAVPPTLHFNKPNPQLHLAETPFRVNNTVRQWPRTGEPRFAAVNSFGIGGTNAHAILSEAPAQEDGKIRWDECLLALSAKSATALDELSRQLAGYLETHPEISLADAAYTLQVGRKHFPYRKTMVCASREEAVRWLREPSPTASRFEAQTGRRVVFLFSGQGSQHPGMAAGLARTEPEFRKWLDECARIVDPLIGVSLRKLLFEQPSEGSSPLMNQTGFAQPALFAVEYALAKMWMKWGITPEAMIGHSVGEYVAACLAGVFTLEDALRLIVERGRLMQSMRPGVMLAVPLAAAQLKTVTPPELSIAAVNTPGMTTVAGSESAAAGFEALLGSQGISVRRLHTSHAFHSPLMDDAMAPFAVRVASVRRAAPSLPFISNLTGTWITAELATDPGYWANHLRHTVLFADGLKVLLEDPARVFLEVGPGQVLTSFVREAARGKGPVAAWSSLPHPKQEIADTAHLLATAGELWKAGVCPDWKALHDGEVLHRVPLPGYPFERRKFRVEPDAEAPGPSVARRAQFGEWFFAPTWKRSAVATAPSPAESASSWLVFAATAQQRDLAAAELTELGVRFAIVQPGSGYRRQSANEFAIDPAVPNEYLQLWDDLRGSGLEPGGLLYLWGTAQGDAGLAQRHFDSLLYLAQAVGEKAPARPLNLIIVTNLLYSITGNEGCRPESALLTGPAKVIPHEYPSVMARLADFDAMGPGTVRTLLAEAALPPSGLAVGYRQGIRWEQTLTRIRLEGAGINPLLRTGGTYLITGGFGGIGRTLAKHVAQRYSANLVLTTRRPVETDGAEAQFLLELESLGGAGLAITADLGDRQAMSAAISQAGRRFQHIDGVIHAAGLPGNGIIQLKNSAMAASVMRPKVEGTILLAELLAGDPPDFLLLCSSIDSVYGSAGGVDYCAGNAFLDAFAASRPLPGCRVVSINWDAWQEVGMAARAAAQSQEFKARLTAGLLPSEGVEAFERALRCTLPQLAAVAHDMPAVLEQLALRAAKSLPEETHSASASQALGTSPGEAAVMDTVQSLTGIWTELLGQPDIGPDDDFFALGGHSLLGASLLARLQKTYGVSLPLRALFEAPTIRQLAQRVDTMLWVSAGAVSTANQDREELEL